MVLSDVGDRIDSVHVKVMKVDKGSQAHRKGITRNMYLKSLALSKPSGEFCDPIILGASSCRQRRSQFDRDSDVWRHNDGVDRDRKVDIRSLTEVVDNVLANALLSKKCVRVEFVSYKC